MNRSPQNRSTRTRSFALAFSVLFLLSMGLRLGCLAAKGAPEPTKDPERHLYSAGAIWNEHTYRFLTSEPHVADPVLYPLFLSPFVGLFGPRPLAALIVQSLLVSACEAVRCWV